MKIRITIDVELEPAWQTTDDDERICMESVVLIADGSLILHSNEAGDEIGRVVKVGRVEWIEEEKDNK